MLERCPLTNEKPGGRVLCVHLFNVFASYGRGGVKPSVRDWTVIGKDVICMFFCASDFFIKF